MFKYIYEHIKSLFAGTDKRKLVVIGDPSNAECLAPVKSMPVDYYWTSKAWMTLNVFENVLKRMDDDMLAQNRNVIMFLDHAIAHGEVVGLQNRLKAIELAYLPPNTNAQIQPLDQGIMNSLKLHYRNRMLRRTVAKLEKGQSLRPIGLMEAIDIISQCWHVDISMEFIRNCFRKAGFINHEYVIDDDDIYSKSMQTIVELQTTLANFAQLANLPDDEAFDVNDFAFIDQNTSTCRNDTEADPEDWPNETPAQHLSTHDANQPVTHDILMNSLSNIRMYLQQNEGTPVDIFQHLDAVAHFLDKSSAQARI